MPFIASMPAAAHRRRRKQIIAPPPPPPPPPPVDPPPAPGGVYPVYDAWLDGIRASAAFKAPGYPNWENFMSKCIDDPTYYTTGGGSALTQSLGVRSAAAMQAIRAGVVAGAIAWSLPTPAPGSYAGFLANYLHTAYSGTSAAAAAVYMFIMTDYFTNHKRLIGGYYPTSNTPFSLTQGTGVLPALLSVMAGYIKYVDVAPLGVAAVYKPAISLGLRVAGPLSGADRAKLYAMLTPEQFFAFRRGILLDHTIYLICTYRNSGAVPNQRVSGLEMLLILGHIFAGHCGDDTTDYDYAYTLGGETRSFTRLADIAQNAFDEALVGILDSLADEFWSDGPLLERSGNYNPGTVAIATAAWKTAIVPSIEGVATRYEAWLDAMRMPGNVIPPIGNRPGDGNARTPDRLVGGSVVYPFGGYAVLRDGPGALANYAFMNFGTVSRGHYENGVHVLIIKALGSLLLTSGGGSTYKGGTLDGFASEKCSFKLNTWLVDNLNVVGAWTDHSPTWGRIGRCPSFPARTRFATSPIFDIMERESYVLFGGLFGSRQKATSAQVRVTHHRAVVFCRSEATWFVIDRLVPEDGEPHLFRHTWNLQRSILPADVQLTPTGFYTARSTGVNVYVSHDAPMLMHMYYAQLTSETPYASNASPPPTDPSIGLLGWCSLSQGSEGMVPAVNVHSLRTASGPQTVVTTIRAAAAGSALPVLRATATADATGFECQYLSYALRFQWAGAHTGDYTDGIFNGATKLLDIPYATAVTEGPEFEAFVPTSGDGAQPTAPGFSSLLPYVPAPHDDVMTVEYASLRAAGAQCAASADTGPYPRKSGTALLVGGADLGPFDYVVRRGSFVVDESWSATEWFTDAKDRGAWVVVDGDLTIASGCTFRPPARKLYAMLYVTGNVVVDGALSMTARGANHSGLGDSAGYVAPATIVVDTGAYSTLTTTTTTTYPIAAVTAATPAASYVAASSASAGASEEAWNAFDGDDALTGWRSVDSYSPGQQPMYAGGASTLVGGVPVAGEWLQLTLPAALQVFGYALTGDVAAFTVAGSNDGLTWDLVDARSGVSAGPGAYACTAPTAYLQYRLVATAASSGSSVQITEWTLNDIQSTATTSDVTTAHPTGAMTGLSAPAPYVASSGTTAEAAWYAFDRSTVTRWRGSNTYVNGNHSYPLQPVATVVSGVSTKGDWLQIALPSAMVVSGYVITPSGVSNAPSTFTFAGSSDGGGTWHAIDSQSGISGYTTRVARTFACSPPGGAAYSLYRLVISTITTTTGTTGVQLAEFAVLTTAAVTTTTTTGTTYPTAALTQPEPCVVSASSTYSTTTDKAWEAFDKNTSTQWISDSHYIDGLPDLARYAPSTTVDGAAIVGDWLQLALPSAVQLSGYTMTPSIAARAPTAFTLAGSNNGKTWFSVDSRSGQSYTAGVAKAFACAPTIAFAQYRLIWKQLGAPFATGPQLAEFTVTGSSATVSAVPLRIAATGSTGAGGRGGFGTSGAGGAGTCFSGGAGSGGSTTIYPLLGRYASKAGGPNGGAGSDATSQTCGGGGAGNPGGADTGAGSSGTAGTGGTLIAVCLGSYGGSGTVAAGGAAGGHAGYNNNNYGGGGSGGGCVMIACGSDAGGPTPTASGGAGGLITVGGTGSPGAAGGTGTVTVVTLL